MALILPHSIFFHIPKTGGTWVREAIKRAGIPTLEIGDWHYELYDLHQWCAQISLSPAVVQQKFTFAFVRNPLDWYPSYWAFRQTHGWPKGELTPCRSNNFEQFMWNVIWRFPGYLSNLYTRYLGPLPGVLNFVGRREILGEDLITALTLAGEQFDLDAIRSTPPANVGADCPRLDDHWLRWAVQQTERRAMVAFGYA